jgi:GGDEF domain-containing protein
MNKSSSILIASDDPKTRQLTRTAVEAEGFEPILCGNGEEAYESIQKQIAEGKLSPLMVLEAFLPKMDGFEIIKKLEDIPEAKQMSFLMYLSPSKQTAAQTAPSQILSARIKLLADNYLQKPFDLKEVQGAIHSMTKYHRAHGAPHPVTALPGHPQLEQEIFRRLARGETFGFLWADINHFRPFNDHYGAEKGNQAIQWMHQTIQKILDSSPYASEPPPAFLAHIDGDDFVLLLHENDLESVQNNLCQQFDDAIDKFYSAQEVQLGFFYGKERKDQKERVFPLMHISTIGLKVSLEKFIHYGQLVTQASDWMDQAKISAEHLKLK